MSEGVKKMKRKHLILVLFAMFVSLCSSASVVRSLAQHSAQGYLTEEFHQSYQLAPGGRIQLENINGDVRVRGWDRNEVKVDAVKRAYTQERLSEAEIVVNASANVVRIETRYPYSTMNWTNGEGRRNNPALVEYVLTVPRGARLHTVETINGSLDVEGLTGDVEASSVNGKVSARSLTGPIKLSTVNGRLDVTLESLNDADPVSLGSVNGQVSVVLPSDINAEIRANTVHGPITNEFGLPVRKGKYVGRDLAGRFGSGGARVKLDNVNGSIQIKRAADGRTPNNVTNLLSETAHADGEWGEVDREIERGVREAQREAARETREALREAARERREAQTEANRERLEAQREIQRETAEIAREAERISREVTREVTQEVARAMSGRGDRRQIERESNTFAATGVSRVRLANFDGPITVIAWDKPEVMYTAVKRAFDEGEMKGIKIVGAARGGEAVVLAEFDKSKCHSVDAQGAKIVSFSCDASVELEVYVPRAMALNVSSSDGRLRVEGVRGDLELRTGDGTIDVSGGQGRLKANTGDGRIRVVDFKGEATAETGDGRIMLEGDFSQLSARTGDGAISVSVPEGTNAVIETNAEMVVGDGVTVEEEGASHTARGLRRWKVGSGGGRTFTLRTGDGQVILRRR